MLVPNVPKLKRAETAFFDALLNLLLEKEYEDISVSDLVTASGYSRSAFYSNFVDKEQMLSALLEYMELSYVHSTYDTYRDKPEQISKSYYTPMLGTFRVAYENRKFYRLLFAGRIPNMDLNSFNQRTEQYFRKSFNVEYIDSEGSYDIDMYWYINGMKIFNFIVFWDMNDWKYTPEYMAENAARLLTNIHSVARSQDKKILIRANLFSPPELG